MKFMPEVSEATDISWWTENRKKINEAIKCYNSFAEGNRERNFVLTKVNQIREYGTRNDFADWQYKI
jgi:Zn ribbon nucleic-acid-binding protein